MPDHSRQEQIADAVDQFIKPGEAWVIRKEEAGTDVTLEGRSALATTHPELYGRLLQVSEQLSNAGGSLCIWGPLLVLLLCLGLHLNWFDAALGPFVDKLRNIWLYLLAATISFFLFGSLATFWERLAYRQYREAILRALDDANLPPHRLIALIEGDKSLDNLADQLKADRQLI